jgi:hypothetical protein
MSKIPISEEVLAESFMEATLELELEHKCYDHDISIPTEELEQGVNLITHSRTAFPRKITRQISPITRKSIDQKQKQSILRQLNNEGKNFWRDLKKWFVDIVRPAKNKLKKIADMLRKKLKHFKNTVSDYFLRIRRYLYKWILQNSAIKSFNIGKESPLVFTANKITSTGTFEFGGEFGLKDIITGLKNMPKIKLSVEVEYTNPSSNRIQA